MEHGDGSIVELEEGWGIISAGMAKIRRSIESDGKVSQDPIQLYTMVYNMCTQKRPHDYSQQLYERYKEDADNYNRSTVLPPLREVQGEILLRHLVEVWRKHKRILMFEGIVFRYLERYYIPRYSLPVIKQLGSTSFHALVFNEVKSSVTETVIAVVNDEREGKLVDRELLKNVLDMYVQIGSGSLDTYQVDFESAFCHSTRNYYATKSQTWILEYSHPDYMLKVEDCVHKEMERAAHYLHSSSEPKISEAVRSELMAKYQQSHSGLKKKSEGTCQ